MSTFTTYRAVPAMSYGQPGYENAIAAASAINRNLGDSGEASFQTGDEFAARSAWRAVEREMDSCHPDIRANLVVEETTVDIED
jgi:hypothetical protein